MTVPLTLPLLLTATLLTGCASRPSIYQWGSYEEQVYKMYSAPETTSPKDQIAALEADLDKAFAANRPLPPGHHAHLGFLYFQDGQLDRAVASFETEKRLFPESRAYMDRLIARTRP